MQNLSEQFSLSPAEGLLCRRVHERHPSLGVPQEQRISGIVGYGSGEVELVLQRFFGAFALGNVVLHPDKANEVTLLIAHGGDGEFVPEEGAVLLVVAQGHLAVAPLPYGGTQLL